MLIIKVCRKGAKLMVDSLHEEKIKNLLNQEIKKQYGSLRNYTIIFNRSYSTIYSAFQRGIGGIGVKTFNGICNDLNIDITELLVNHKIKYRLDQEKIKKIDTHFLNKVADLDNNEFILLNNYLDFIISKRDNNNE